MPKKAEENTQAVTGVVCVRDESVEAVVHHDDRVDIYLKSGSVIPIECIDSAHAEMRYDDAKRSIKFGVHSADVTEIEDSIKEYMDAEESSSED
jgi:hypothetical protein